MAIVNNLWLRGAKKKLGGTVVYQVQGRTLQRELAPSVSNPRTTLQMGQRIKWSNLVNFYRLNKDWQKRAYENKKRTQSDYNKFMSLNVTNSTIALTKEEAAAGVAIVVPYRISEGSLPSIEVTETGSAWYTNIFLSSGFSFTANTTVAQFAQSVLSTNAGVREGDQLSFVRITQLTNATTGLPYAVSRFYEVVLDTSLNVLLSSFMPTDLFETFPGSQYTQLAVHNNGGDGAWAFILSRTTAGKTAVSTQELTQVNNTAYVSKYTSAAQIAKAIASYGETSEVLLNSNSANPIGDVVTPLSLNNYRDLYGPHIDGSAYPLVQTLIESEEAQLNFSGSVQRPSSVLIKVVGESSPQSMTIKSVVGSKVVIGLPASPGFGVEGNIESVTAVIAGENFTLNFTSGGLDVG